jgi:hypothetical protein
VETIGEIIGKKRPIVSVFPCIGYMVGWFISKLVKDRMITPGEIKGLMANLLYVDSPAAGTTKLTGWAAEHSSTLGLKYTSELVRRTDPIFFYFKTKRRKFTYKNVKII